jgi:hypothetical protein
MSIAVTVVAASYGAPGAYGDGQSRDSNSREQRSLYLHMLFLSKEDRDRSADHAPMRSPAPPGQRQKVRGHGPFVLLGQYA